MLETLVSGAPGAAGLFSLARPDIATLGPSVLVPIGVAAVATVLIFSTAVRSAVPLRLAWGLIALGVLLRGIALSFRSEFGGVAAGPTVYALMILASLAFLGGLLALPLRGQGRMSSAAGVDGLLTTGCSRPATCGPESPPTARAAPLTA